MVIDLFVNVCVELVSTSVVELDIVCVDGNVRVPLDGIVIVLFVNVCVELVSTSVVELVICCADGNVRVPVIAGDTNVLLLNVCDNAKSTIVCVLFIV